MSPPMPDPLIQHIYFHIEPRRGKFPEHVVRTIAGNIAFLVRYICGPSVDLTTLSISIIDVRGKNNSEVGHKAMVTVHDGPGKFTTIIEKQVPWGKNIICGLTEKVDKVIKEISEKEGNKGLGDFKV